MATRTVSTKLAISGESEYRAAISNINAELKNLQSALKLTESQYQTNANSMQALQEKHDALTAVQEAQKKKVDELRQALENAKSAEENYGQQKDEIKAKIEANNQALATLKSTTGDTAKEEARLTEENAKLQQELANVDAKLSAAEKGTNNWQTQLNNAEIQLNNLDAEIQKNDKYLDEAKNSSDGCAKSIDSFGREVKSSTEETEKQTTALEALATAMASEEIAGFADKIAGALKACVTSAMDFEHEMSGVAAIANASTEEIDALSEKAKEIGATTMFTAQQAAEAMSYMALAGWDAQEMMDGVSGVINLAAASGENLATVSDIVTDALTAFGLSAQDADHFVDVLASTAANSNTTVTMLGEAFKYAAPLAGALGYDVEDVAVAMGLMANQGIKGSQAGTTLRTMFSKLSGTVKLSGEAFGEVEISSAKSDGTMKSLSETLDELRGYFGQMTDAEKLANAEAIAGKYAMSGLTALMNTTQEDFDELTASITDCSGAAAQMAEIRMDNLQGQVTLLESAFDGFKIAVGETLAPLLRDIAEAGTEALTKATEFVKEHPQLTEALTLVATGFVGITTAMAGIKAAEKAADVIGLLEPLKSISEAATLAGGGISGLVTALGTIAVPAAVAATAIAGVVAVVDRINETQTIGLLGEGHELEEYAANVDSYRDAIERCKQDIDNLALSGGDLTMAYDELSLMESALKNATDEYAAAQEAANQVQEEGVEATESAVQAANNQAAAHESVTAGLKGIAEAYRDAYNSCRESLDGQIGLFDTYNAVVNEDTATATQLLIAWGEQTSNLDNYTRDLKLAGEYGLSQGLVQSLADGSTTSAGYLHTIITEIQACANGTGTLGTSAEEAVAAFNASFANTSTAKDELAETMATINTDLETALALMEQQAADVDFNGFWDAVDLAFADVGVKFKEIGLDIDTGAQSGIDEGAEAVAAAAEDMMEGVETAAKTEAAINSPSKVFEEIGQNIDQGLLNGINAGNNEIIRAVTDMGDAMVQKMRTSGETASSTFISILQALSGNVSNILANMAYSVEVSMSGLPYEMEYIGSSMIDGMIQGLANESGYLYDTVATVVNNAILTARYAAGVRSPSWKTREIFENVAEGMIVGVESKKEDVADATSDVITSALIIDQGAITQLSQAVGNAVPDYQRLLDAERKRSRRDESSYSSSQNPVTINNDITINTLPEQNSKEIAEEVMYRMQIEYERKGEAY